MRYLPLSPTAQDLSAHEIDLILKSRKNDSCSFQSFAAHWLYYHDYWAQAHDYNQRLLEDASCEIFFDQNYLLKSLILARNNQWNQAVMALLPLLERPEDGYYQKALFLQKNFMNSRSRSIADLSPQEDAQLKKQQDLMESSIKKILAQEPKNLLILYDTPPSQDVIDIWMESFNELSFLKDVRFVKRDSVEKNDIPTLAENRYILGYQLDSGLEKDWYTYSLGTLMTEVKTYQPQRRSDYFLVGPDDAFIRSLYLYQQSPLIPGVIFYDKNLPVEMKALVESFSDAYSLDVYNKKEALRIILNLPQREKIFEKIFPQSYYLALAQPLPYALAFIGSPEASEKFYDMLAQYYPKNFFFFYQLPETFSASVPTAQAIVALKSTIDKESVIKQHLKDSLILALSLHLFENEPLFAYFKESHYYTKEGQYISPKFLWTLAKANNQETRHTRSDTAKFSDS